MHEKFGAIKQLEIVLKSSLLKCYQKHTKPLAELYMERQKLHNEAIKLKIQVDKILADCMNSDNKFNCLSTSVLTLAKKVRPILEKYDKHLKKEYKVRKKSMLTLLGCDKTATKHAFKEGKRIIETTKRCMMAKSLASEEDEADEYDFDDSDED